MDQEESLSSAPPIDCGLKTARWKYFEGVLYLVVVGGFTLWRHFFLPDSEGTWFFQLWTAGIFAVPLFYYSLRPFPARFFAVLFFPVAVLVQALMPFYHLYGAGTLLFSIIWIVGWRHQERNSTRGHRNFGMLFGLIFVGFGFLELLGELFMIPTIVRLESIDPSQVESIEFAHGETIQTLDSEKDIQAFISALQKTYPYSPNHEGIRDPWTCRIIGRGREEIVARFQVGNGNSANPNAIWILLEDHDYQNTAIAPILRGKTRVDLWN